MDEYASALLQAVDEATAPWVERCISRTAQRQGVLIDADRVGEAGKQARTYVVTKMRALLSTGVDEQRTTPLAVMREATLFANHVLDEATVAPVERDDYQRERFPEDIYDLTPASWADVDDALVDPAVRWGASKVMAHKRAHQ